MAIYVLVKRPAHAERIFLPLTRITVSLDIKSTLQYYLVLDVCVLHQLVLWPHWNFGACTDSDILKTKFEQRWMDDTQIYCQVPIISGPPFLCLVSLDHHQTCSQHMRTLSGRFMDKKWGFIEKSYQNMATNRPNLTSWAPFESWGHQLLNDVKISKNAQYKV